MNYKALITDLDGTAVKLSSSGEDISEATIKTVTEAKNRGFKIACATGRRWSYTKNIVEKLNITNSCIVAGGTQIVDPLSGKTIWEKSLDRNALDATLDIFQRESNKGKLSTANMKGRSIDSISSVSDDSRFMYLLGIEANIADNICNIINAQGFAVAHSTLSWSGGSKLDVHVTHPEATKEHALVKWHELENVSKAETIAMGDSGNDIPLFQSAGLKIAVSNATSNLKQLADYIAPNEKQQALEHVINKFLLN